VEKLAPGVMMKQRGGLVGAGILSLALTAGCGVEDRKPVFGPSETLPERALPANAGSAAVAVPPVAPAAPPSAMPSPSPSDGRDGVPSMPSLTGDSSRPAPAPPAPEPAPDEPA